MFALRMIQLIESHADRLANELMRRLMASERCRDLVRKVPRQELEMRTHEIYRHLSDWLLSKTESEIEAQYIGLGMRRVKQGVPFSDLLFALAATKECLWEYLEREGLLEDPVELLGDLNLLHSLGRFFDRIGYAASLGYENAYRQENIRPPLASVSGHEQSQSAKTA